MSVTPVEPKLDKELMDYITNIGDFVDVSKINKEQVSDYIGKVISDDETFASFIATVDRFPRSEKAFQTLTALHIKAIQESEDYKVMYKRASKYPELIDSSNDSLPRLIAERFEWNKLNPPAD